MISADIPKLVQRKTGHTVTFKAVAIEEAQAVFRAETEQIEAMRKMIHVPCREVLESRLTAKRLRKILVQEQ